MRKAKKPISLLLAFLIAVSLILPSVPAARADKPPGETAGEVSPEVTIPEITVPETTVPETEGTEPVLETTVPTSPEATEPSPTEPLETEPPVPETSAPTEPMMTAPTVPETSVPETTVPETVPATTAPEETTAPTESPFLSPTPLLENLPADFQSKVQVPEVMKDNLVLDALTELGYPVDQLQNAGVLYDYNYTSIMMPEAYRTGIPYGGGSTGLESVDHIRANGLVCASFISYYLWNFLPQHGVNTTVLTESFTGNYTSVPDVRALLETAAANTAQAPDDVHVLKRERKDLAEAAPGDLLFYGDEHCAIYLGTADLVNSFTGETLKENAIFLAHCGTNRGVEITTNGELESSGLQLTNIYSLKWSDGIVDPNDDYFIQVGDIVYLSGGREEIERYAARKTIQVVDMQFMSIGDTWYDYYSNLDGKNVTQAWRRGMINEIGYAKLSDGTIAYCIEPWKVMPDGTIYDKPFDAWHDTKREGIARAMAYGSPNNGDTSREGMFATQIVLWDIACGYRYLDGSYTIYGTPFTSTPFQRAIANNSKIREKYELIIHRMRIHGTIPSFTSKTEGGIGAAQTITLKQSSNSTYTASVKDNNAILTAFRFPSPVDGMTFSYSGSTLNITATAAAASKLAGGVVVRSRRSSAAINKNDPIVWTKSGTNSNGREYQEIVTIPTGIDPVPCFFKVKAEVNPGAATVKKTADGSPAGYCFKMYKWEGSKSYYGKTDGSGNMYQTDANFNQKTGGYEWTGLTDGTYTFKEVLSAHGAGQVFPTSWRITVTDKHGRVTYDKLYTGSQIIKESNGDARLADAQHPVTGLSDGGRLTMTIHNSAYDAPFTLKKTMKGDPDVIAQLQGNKCYSLKGAEYGVYKGGAWQETITTDANGEAHSAKRYPDGTVLTVRETKAPPGFKLDNTVHTITIRSGQSNVLNVADEPVFDPDVLQFEKKDPKTGLTVPQGNAKFVGAVFRWDYYDNQKWEGAPKRTWFFETKSVGNTTAGRCYYDLAHLAGGYDSDQLYFIREYGKVAYRIPVGSIRITEVKAPAGYGQIPELKATITQPTNGGKAEFKWTPESAAIVQSKDGKYLFPEPEDRSTFASISIQKRDADTGGAAPNGANFAGCEFTVYNRSANPVKIGNFPVAAPGEACYVLTLDAAGRAATGAEFPLGKYEIRETKGNAYYQCNTGWSQTFEVTMGGNTAFSFTVANTPVKGHIQLQKINSETGAGLTGAVFQVTHPDGKTSYMTEQPGGIHRIENLRYGSYKVQEVKAPEGYLLDPTVYTVNITENGKTYVVQTAGFNGIANEPIRGHFRVTKVETGTTTPLQGAEYTVKAPDGSLIGVYTTDASGSFEVRDLLYGKGYTYQETKAPAGYLVDPTVYKFDITEDDRTYTYTREDAPQPGFIAIKKFDTHNNPMSGVTCKLEYSLDDGGTWLPVTSRAPDAPLTPGTSSTPGIVDGVLTTNENGALLFDGLRINSQTRNIRYRLTEVATTNGHTLLAGTAFDGYLDQDHPTQIIVATNGAAFELPTSGSTELAVVQLIGAALIVLALIGFAATSFSSKLDQTEEKKKHRK